MTLKNAKHERFAQAVADGNTVDESYVIAGYSRNRGNAARLNANESVIARVREILEARRQQSDVTIESMTKRFNKAVKNADERGADAAVMAGLNTLAKMHGLITEKHRVENVDTMEEDELAAERRRLDAEIAELREAQARSGPAGTRPTTH